jgi:23S rRNA pseudouridine2605 synthase
VKERIQKVLANAGVASRRHVEEMVREGRVTVNGKVVRDLPVLIDPAKDRVAVDTENIRLTTTRGGPGPDGQARPEGRRLYIMLNKPRGVYTTNVAQGTQTRAIDLLPADLPGRVYPVGQLDAESKGLVLLTNDGELTNRLTHPRFGIAKTYRAVIDGLITPEALKELERSVWIADPKMGVGFKSGRSHITIVKKLRDKSVLDITIREGRNREVRRVLAAMGHKVREFTRIALGPLELDRLKIGDFRELTAREVKALRAAVEDPAEKHAAPSSEKRTRGRNASL